MISLFLVYFAEYFINQALVCFAVQFCLTLSLCLSYVHDRVLLQLLVLGYRTVYRHISEMLTYHTVSSSSR